jgi:hypothetical protein
MARVVSHARVLSAPFSTHADFYRPSSHDIATSPRSSVSSARSNADEALARVINQLEQLCAQDDAEQVIAGLLRKFNAVTGLSGWSDPTQLH